MRATKKSLFQRTGQSNVFQFINELSIKHASRRLSNHHVGLIPAQHDANTIYNLFKLMSLDKVKTAEGIQLKDVARTTSTVSCDKQDQQWEDEIQQSIEYNKSHSH